MQPSQSNVPRRSFRYRGTDVLFRLALFGLVAITCALATPLAGAADPGGPTPAPTPYVSASPDASRFAITGPTFSPTNTVVLEGSKAAGSRVTVHGLGSSDQPLCTIAPDQETTWQCDPVEIADGKDLPLTAEQDLGGTLSEATATIDVLGAPTIDGTPGYPTTGLVSGTAFGGATVTATLDDSTPGCTTVASDNGYWSCSLNVGSGGYTVQATQFRADVGNGASSSPSASLDIVVDKDAPASPVITSPRAGTRVVSPTVVFSGTGENGGTVDVYIDKSPVCLSSVSGGVWTCSYTGAPNGTHSMLAIQRDAAGNFSAPSPPMTVFFGPKPAAAAPPGTVPPPPTQTPTPSPTPTPTPVTPRSSPVPPPSDPSAAANPWGAPTGFGASLPTVSESVTGGNWLGAPLLALGYIVLVALPLRLLASALRGRFRKPTLRLTGRNRHALPEEDARPRVNPWLAGTVPLAAAAAVIELTVGINDELRYLRLTAAVMLGLALLNVGVAVSARLALRRQKTGRLRFLPIMLVAALLSGLLSRITGIEPPLVVGVLLGLGFVGALPAKPRAIANLVEVGSVTVLAVLAWLGWSSLGPVEGFWALTLEETLATVAIAGFGSAVILLLPIAGLPGRAILEWSFPVWLGAIAVASIVASAVILGGKGVHFPIIGSIAVAAAFTAVSLAVWAWLRFVEPSPATSDA